MFETGGVEPGTNMRCQDRQCVEVLDGKLFSATNYDCTETGSSAKACRMRSAMTQLLPDPVGAATIGCSPRTNAGRHFGDSFDLIIAGYWRGERRGHNKTPDDATRTAEDEGSPPPPSLSPDDRDDRARLGRW